MTLRGMILVLIVLITFSACNSPTKPDDVILPPGEQPLPPDNPKDEIYYAPELGSGGGYIFDAGKRISVPEGAIKIQITKVKPGRGSVLILDSPSYYSSAGITYNITTRADLPDFFYQLWFKLVDENGNELPTHWFEGGTTGPFNGIRPNIDIRDLDYMVVVTGYSNIPANIPSLRIKYPWGSKVGGYNGFIMNNDGSETGTILKPALNWHLQSQ